MMFMIVIEATMLFMLLALAYSYGPSAIRNEVYLLGITLPRTRRREQAVCDIAKRYRLRNRYIALGGLAACPLQLLFRDYVSVILLYLFLWFFTLMFLYENNMKKYAWKLYELKQEQGWLSEKKYVRRVDTVVSAEINRLSVKGWWLLFPAVLCGYSIFRLFSMDNGRGVVIVTMAYAGCALMFALFYFALCHMRNKVYCSDSKINLKVNGVIRFEWSRCMVIHCYGAAMMALLATMGNVFHIKSTVNFPFQATMFFLLFFLPIGYLFAAYQKVARIKREVFDFQAGNGEEGVKIYDDDDIYYLTGRKNPNAGFMQEKRAGIGFSINVGKTGERVILGLIMLFVAGMALFMLKFDLADITLTVREENGVKKAYVAAADMGDSFYLEDVLSVTMLEKRPAMSKSSGYDGTKYYFGTFQVSGYGACQVYVCLKTKTVLLVETKDRIYFINGEDEEETRQMYRLLTEQDKQ